MSCENYNPIAAAAAAPNIPAGTPVPYESALVGKSCWCCEVGAIYTGFGGGLDPDPICENERHFGLEPGPGPGIIVGLG